MATKTKKEIIQCDYCNIEKDANSIYTARKQFAGCKIIDILQDITRRSIPATIAIKLCSLCASTLLAATGTILKAEEIVSQSLAQTAKKPNLEAAPTKKVADTSIVEPSILQASAKKQKEKINKSLTNGSPTSAKENDIAKVPGLVTPLAAISSPIKLCRFEELQNVVKLTPVKDVPIQEKSFITKFFSVGNSKTERDEEEYDGDHVDNKNKDKSKQFECSHCDFSCGKANDLKKHLRLTHNKKHPRIYNCPHCTKKFARLISRKTHMLEHNLTEEKVEEPKQCSDLAVVTALKPKPLVNHVNEPIFKVAYTNSSTPKPDAEMQPKNKCDECHMEFETIKSMVEHMNSVHDISQAFKCNECNSKFSHKWTMFRHFRAKHGPDAVVSNGKQITERRKTTDTTKNSLAKIKRRKTVATELISQLKEDMEESVEACLEEVFKEPTQVNTASPRKSQPKEDSQLAQSLIFPKDYVSPKKQKSYIEKLQEDVAGESSETPSKRISIENGKKVAVTPTKLQKKDLKKDTPSKKQKSKLETDVLDSPQSTETITNGQAKKKRTRNASDKQAENLSQEDTADEELLPRTPADNSAVKSDIETIDLIEEINSNVKPHKRVKLESFSMSVSESELSCNLCSKVVVSRKRLDSHMQKRHAAQLKCPKCKSTYATIDEYISHFNTCYPDGGGLACGIHKCEKMFLTPIYLSSHLKKKHKLK